MRNEQLKNETIGTVVQVPKDLSLRLARLILNRAEQGRRCTKPGVIIEMLRDGLTKEEKAGRDERQ
jgi:hypothetical protein